MSTRTLAWAYQFKHIKPEEKFVLVTMADEIGERGETGNPTLDVEQLPQIAEVCNLDLEPQRFQRCLDELQRRGLTRTAPGGKLELCTFIDPGQWNAEKQKFVDSARHAATAGKNGRR